MPPWSDSQPLHNGPERDADAWAYWTATAAAAAWGGASPAPDRPGAGPAGAGTDRAAGTGGHGPADWRTPTPLAAIDAGPAPRAWLQLLHPEPGAVTVIHGDGGVGKGTLAAWLAAQASHQQLVLVLDAEGHPREWRRRVGGLGGRLERVWWVGHPGGRIDPQDYAAAGVGLVIVDSAAYFTPPKAEPWGPDAAVALQEAARASGVPWLVLAHQAKGSDGSKAYGSGFWHNVPRAAHGITRAEDGTRVLACTKATDLGELQPGQAWAYLVEYAADGITPTKVELQPLELGRKTKHQLDAEYLEEWRSRADLMAWWGLADRACRQRIADLELVEYQPSPTAPKVYRWPAGR